MTLWAGISFSGEPPAEAIKAAAQDKVAHLLQSILIGDSELGTSTDRVRSSAQVETAFREACGLMPSRLDLRFGLASSLVSQALQTKGVRLVAKVRDALRVYQEIQDLDPTGFDAAILHAAFGRAIGETNASEGDLRALLKTHPERTTDYVQRFERTDRILQTPPTEIPCRTMPRDEHHVIVVLGAGLETNGTVKVKLVARLEQARKLAEMYPRAPLLLTGGNQKAGVTEAYAMSQWLMKKGISSSRLILEDRAADTVENALYCSAILQKLGASHVTLITSPSHIHRGLVDLQEACLQRGLNAQIIPLAASAKGDVPLDPEQERVGVYRDLMRVSGIWSVPGIRR